MAVSVLVFILAKLAIIRSGGLGETATFGGLLDFSNYQRLVGNIIGLEMFFERPFVGVGLLNYFNVYANHSNYFAQFPMVYQLPVIHSWLFALLAEQGLLGALSFCWLITLAFRDIFKCIKASLNDEKFFGIIVFSIFFTLVFNGLFYWPFYTELIFPVVFGLLLGYVKIISKRNLFNPIFKKSILTS
jgi:O-antigen ligase